MPPSDRREALEELVQTPGWGLFVRHVQEEFSGAGYMTRMGLALDGPDPLAPKVLHKTAQEMLRLIAWPESQLRQARTGRNAHAD